MNEINKGTRIINSIIDITFIAIVSAIIVVIFNSNNKGYIFYPIYLAYYFFFEAFKGQTLGKIITKTIVVDIHNAKPSIGRILFRTVLRLNPFDGVSYLFGQEQGAHDIISKTKLINNG